MNAVDRDFTLVMSASIIINPNGMFHISDESKRGRVEQYINTLAFYAKCDAVRKILFVDNSGYDLSRIKKQVLDKENKIEYLSLDCNNYPGKWGKGYGEFLIMDRAMEFLRANNRDEMVVKVTGRYPILNIGKMVKEFLSRPDLMLGIDVIDHKIYDLLRLKATGHSCRTIIWAVMPSFYMQNIYGLYATSPGNYRGAEHFMRCVWEKVKHNKGVYARFCNEPRLSGFSGAENHFILNSGNYDGWLNTLKRASRQFVRWVIPQLWI